MGQAFYLRFSTSVGLTAYSVNEVTEERTGNHYERFEHRTHAARDRGGN